MADRPPPTQYIRTRDGISVAYWTLGEGPPIVYLPPGPGHTQLDWQLPQFRLIYKWLASSHKLIRIDPRNTGASQRGVKNLSLEARQLDVGAVAEELGLESFALLGHGGYAAIALGYAAFNPGRVRRLVLVDACVWFPDLVEKEEVQALRTLVEVNWELYTESFGAYLSGLAVGAESRSLASLIRRSQDWDDAKRSLATPVHSHDLLSGIAAPTLIVQHVDALLSSIDAGQHLAHAIPDARLVVVDGKAVVSSPIAYQLTAAVDSFLATHPAPSPPLRSPGVTLAHGDGPEISAQHESEWDIFISHASEDKEEVARPLKELLEAHGLRVWLDENELFLGDSLRAGIDRGLAFSRYGVVILSRSFFSKDWAQRELNGLMAMETQDRKVILPVWNGIDHSYLTKMSPMIADKRAVDVSTGLNNVADEIVRVVRSGSTAFDVA